MRTVKRFAATVCGLAMAMTGVTATLAAAPAQAAGCYDGAQHFVKSPGVTQIPTGDGWWQTTDRCQDINLRANISSEQPTREVRVCFQATGCQSRWTSIPGDGAWRVVATDVLDGTKYRFQFQDSSRWSGWRAN